MSGLFIKPKMIVHCLAFYLGCDVSLMVDVVTRRENVDIRASLITTSSPDMILCNSSGKRFL